MVGTLAEIGSGKGAGAPQKKKAFGAMMGAKGFFLPNANQYALGCWGEFGWGRGPTKPVGADKSTPR